MILANYNIESNIISLYIYIKSGQHSHTHTHYTYIYIYIYIYTHTHTHKYTCQLLNTQNVLTYDILCVY